MRNAEDYGFSIYNNADDNSAALNKAVAKGGDVYITAPGVYSVSEPVIIGNDTSIYFGAGVYLKREHCKNTTGYVFVNEGAYTGIQNKNIMIQGLKLFCNGVESAPAADNNGDKIVPGLRGHISFYHITNLSIRDCQIPDLPAKDFGIHVCDFENIIIENVRIEGKKDAVHLGCGNKFVIRHGIFKTFDDPIALNAHDYASSNPMLGWITDGIIEDCYDLDDDSTTGFFCRILAGSWCDWQKGMEIQNSDSVVCNNTVYRALMKPDGTVYKSVTPPTHKSGMCIIDGINWVAVQNNQEHSCGCKNIHFKDIFIEKNRPVAFSVHFDKDNFSRSYYPNSPAPVQENITFENVIVNKNVSEFLFSITPVDNIKIINSDLGNSFINFKNINTEGIEYNGTNLCFIGVKSNLCEKDIIKSEDGIECKSQFFACNFKN